MTVINTALDADSAHCCNNDDIVVMPLCSGMHGPYASCADRLYRVVPASSIGVSGATRRGTDKAGNSAGRAAVLTIAAVKKHNLSASRL